MESLSLGVFKERLDGGSGHGLVGDIGGKVMVGQDDLESLFQPS